MNLAELLQDTIQDGLATEQNLDIQGIALDSRKVKKGFVFIALFGANEHGLSYAEQAINNGAVIIIYDQQGSEFFDILKFNCLCVKIDNLHLKLGCMADRFYQSPSKKLDIIGVTGTNGKTSCSQFLLQLLPECGVIGTLGWGIVGDIKDTVNTTPDALSIHEMLVDFVSKQKQKVVMEVSSHGLQQGRVKEVFFKGALFTNLSRDHLDFHGSMTAYLEAKLLLFKQPGLRYVVVNGDDPNSNAVLAEVDSSKTKCWTYSASGKIMPQLNHVAAVTTKYSLSGIAFLVCWNNEQRWVKTQIVGDFNLENMLAVMAVLLAEGYSLNDVVNKVSQLTAVPGRMEGFGGGDKPYVFVDYAHTPDALEKLLVGVKKNSQGKVVLLFGCGGNRDKGKRSEMGAIATNMADQVVITNDNPRYENPEMIIEDIKKGCGNNVLEVIKDRKQAILSVIKNAKKNDCIVIAGKGHEAFQEIEGERQVFSDQVYVKQALSNWF